MNKLFITAAILAVSVTAAEAKCTRKSLNGNWVLGFGGGGSGILGSASGGTFTFGSGGATLIMTITSFSSTKCKGSGSGTSSGTPFTFALNTEDIPGSKQKPNHVFADITIGTDVFMVTAQRQ